MCDSAYVFWFDDIDADDYTFDLFSNDFPDDLMEDAMARRNFSAADNLEDKLADAKEELARARRQYRSELDNNPSLINDASFGSGWAQKFDALQRTESKFTQMLEFYQTGDEDEPLEMPERSRSAGQSAISKGFGAIKETMIRSAKQGVATAVIKQVSDEALLALGDNCPDVLLLLPEPLRQAALCAIVYMATEAYPGLPMSAEAGAVSLLALEATAAKTFADAAATLTPKLAEMFKKLSLLPAAAGAAALIAATNSNKE